VFNGLLDPEFTFYFDDAWYTLNWYVRSQNNRYCSTESPRAIVHEVPVHDGNVEVGSAISARIIIIIGSFFFFGQNNKLRTLCTISSEKHVLIK
jgi:hypothetical protein